MNWFKKETKIEEIDVKKAVANISTEHDNFTITVEGHLVSLYESNDFIVYATDKINNILKSGENFLFCDDGKIVPIHLIKRININVEPLIKKITV